MTNIIRGRLLLLVTLALALGGCSVARDHPVADRTATSGAWEQVIPGGACRCADRLPHAKVTVFGAQSGAWPDNPDFNAEVLGTAWGAYRTAPGWAVEGRTVRDWGIPRFWVQAARHVPGLVPARFDWAYDPHAATEATPWMPGKPPDLLAIIDANEAAIEAAGVTVHSYTAPGANHGIFEFDSYYTLEVGNVRLVDWLRQLAAGPPPGDVRCTACGR